MSSDKKPKNLSDESWNLWLAVKENSRRRDSCKRHNFEPIVGKPFKYKCTECQCTVDGSFILAYKQGLKHGAEKL